MTDQEFIPFAPKRALISVSDKRGIVELAKALAKQGVEIVATGNTGALLSSNNITVTDVSACTKFPEMLDGRVKTLHPAIHAGLLARGKEDDSILREHQISRFDLLIVNLYPFEQVISTHDCDFQTAIENIDIGGPAMIRSAAKNHAHVFVVVTPDDYQLLENYLKTKKIPKNWGFSLAKKAFAHTAAYDAAIANYLGMLDDSREPAGFPSVFTCQFNKQYELRYGENPHQQAIFYSDKNPSHTSLATAKTIQGKQLSYNNLLDADAAFDCVKSFPLTIATCVIVKHGNPCGIAIGDDPTHAYLRAFQADPISAYGGILAFNQPIDEETAKTILEKQFAEVIIAPGLTQKAEAVFATKPAIRVLSIGEWATNNSPRLDMRTVHGGLLVQEHDDILLIEQKLQFVTEQKPSPQEMQDLMFAWLAAKHVKSNAIVLAQNGATIGIGAGQTSRVMSTRIALWQAKEAGFPTTGASMASDAFFPFADNIAMAAEAGISAIIQPGGSIRDEQVITAANEAGIKMVFTGYRHFRH
ncbi:phosphoribosylaminoimidazolecarboxamide formyltransferase and IMP cyclohydrolase (bifunctionnal) [Legionella lansingensis]|uniref:Bifunctional purine biosynthesis protein PurH n=2 Tax=Legionella lansingensis TaxID=45067 RepID=A0A0W0VUB4_9GAMM|nr:bifunctional phosphoribosylaminoimidazolecarboxamide formyltransferase/IMP cyclohydrolase [Legionella lansingensis]KTD23876.1 phosphoribosylaminoimidazolecarboxamide formyltransferase and IMP cyclohydrolase (bifunctional) [Legionella lansingensis]SNV46534.1 phosphoribosylaminoimidazolecarboxamide formyltransferase and IMP cyclohydrolase (bifunctionnal) [Legionella lansingensis]